MLAQGKNVLSDNKRQSVNAHRFKQMILKTQAAATLSDEKQLGTEYTEQIPIKKPSVFKAILRPGDSNYSSHGNSQGNPGS